MASKLLKGLMSRQECGEERGGGWWMREPKSRTLKLLPGVGASWEPSSVGGGGTGAASPGLGPLVQTTEPLENSVERQRELQLRSRRTGFRSQALWLALGLEVLTPGLG